MNSYRARSRRDRIVSAGLASAACIGLVAVIGTRSAEATTTTSTEAATAPTSSQGLTKAQLDAYAARLAQETAQLDAYRAQLTSARIKPSGTVKSGTVKSSASTVTTTVRKPHRASVSKPAPRPVAVPAPRPASHTKSS